MLVDKFIKLDEQVVFNSNNSRGNEDYIIKVKDYMRLIYFPLIKISSGEDPCIKKTFNMNYNKEVQ